MFYSRDLAQLIERAQRFRVISIMGPRQSGKTTLARHVFAQHRFVSFEDPEIRAFAQSDPRAFLREYENEHGLIIDEFQYVPELLSYIQLIVDEKDRPSYFVLTGSQNFLMNQAITQSLAGRVGILTLLPFSMHELNASALMPATAGQLIINGSYPRIYAESFLPAQLYPSYINTYIERDVRQLTNVGDLATFQKFLSLCAGRVGQLLNLSDLAMHCGISAPTAERWLSILEASFIVFRLQPYFKNFNKRMVKRPKLYFYDTGIVSHLLGIQSHETLTLSPFRGALFENLIIADLMKQFFNAGLRPSLYFWRDKNAQVEVDALIEKAHTLIPVEIKSGETIVPAFFNTISKWNEISQTELENNIIVYAGDKKQTRAKGVVLPWHQADQLIDTIFDSSQFA